MTTKQKTAIARAVIALILVIVGYFGVSRALRDEVQTIADDTIEVFEDGTGEGTE